MKRVLKYLVPVLIVFLIVFFPSLCMVWLAKFSTIEDLGIFNLVINILTPFALCASFFLTSLVIKNKKHILWFSVIYIVYLSSPLWIEELIKSNYISWPKFLTDIRFYITCFFSFLHTSIIGMLYYLGFNWLKKNKQLKELEKQNLQSELALLKNQINPHFLFNTLNNIDSLIKSNPDYASQSLIELSDMMRYMLYETNADRVPLQKELNYIEDYLKLQKLQQANPQLVDYSISGNPDEITIAPMLFIPFIENAFKHCTDKEKVYAIRFSINITEKQVSFRASNISDSKRINKDSSSGIGLETVKRRLEILYPNKHSLQIDKKNDLFCVELDINMHD